MRSAALLRSDLVHRRDNSRTGSINPGNSGGPLLDLNGRLIGVTSAGRTVTPDGRIIQGQNYAIGVDRVKQVTDVLRQGRSIGSIDVGFDYLTPSELRRRNLPPGLLIEEAARGSAAERAGLAAGDSLIVAVDGQPIDNSLASYCAAVKGLRPGAPATFSVLTGGDSRPRRVRLPVGRDSACAAGTGLSARVTTVSR